MRHDHDVSPSHDVPVKVKSNFGEEKLVRSYMEEHQQKPVIQGRQWYNRSSSGSKLKQVRIIPPSRLSRTDHSEPTSSSKSKSLATRITMKAAAWRMSSWWEDYPGSRMGVALSTVLLLMIAATFAFSVYIHHEGLKTQFKAHGIMAQSCCCRSRSMMGSFSYDDESSLLLQRQLQERSDGQQIFDKSIGEISGC